jgi:hypothetical protein
MSSGRNSLIGKSITFDAMKIEGKQPREYCRGDTRIFGTGTTRRLWHVIIEVNCSIDGEEQRDENGKIKPNIIDRTSFKPDGKLLLGSELGAIVNANYTATVEQIESDLAAQGKTGEVLSIPVKITVRG